MKLPMTFFPITRADDMEATVLQLIDAGRRGGLGDGQIAFSIFFADPDIHEEFMEIVAEIYDDAGLVFVEGVKEEED